MGSALVRLAWVRRGLEYPVESILRQLSGGDLRSIGRSNQIVRLVSAKPRLFGELFRGLSSGNRLIRMRAADAIEKITLARPHLLRGRARKVLELASRAEEKEFRWHMALLLPRLALSRSQRMAAVDILHDYLRDRSSIVKTFAMQSLADLTREDRSLMSRVLPLIEKLTQDGTPAMRARGRMLLKQLMRR